MRLTGMVLLHVTQNAALFLAPLSTGIHPKQPIPFSFEPLGNLEMHFSSQSNVVGH